MAAEGDDARLAVELNLDGLVGPTHNYAGLSYGNVASAANAGAVADPRTAARQGLAKMRAMIDLGLPQAVLPPQQRPDPSALARLGVDAATPLAALDRIDPALVPTVMSASAMWAANAATVSPSADTSDGRVHLTPANLSSNAHRSFEPAQTTAALRAIFADPAHFVVHEPLPAAAAFADEGAANHGRLATTHGAPGVEVFVYGRNATDPISSATGFPRRQTRLAGELIAANHGLDPGRTVFVRQSPAAIDGGAFHNDVVGVLNQTVVFQHEDALAAPASLDQLVAGQRSVVVPRADVPLADAVGSYLFNSQLVTLPSGAMALIAPTEVAETPSTAAYLDRAVADPDHPISAVHVLDLRQSMRNGGGPACLRLRVALTPAELAAVSGRVVVDHALISDLEVWVDRHYRSEVGADDLRDPDLVDEANRALDELTQLLGLGSLYPFQH
ncbi:MAG: N-succinylarginine dihydrolase [Actinomycetota bacterium]